MKSIGVALLILGLAVSLVWAMDFGLAENSLSEFRAIRYENTYTKIPTTGKLVSIKIADSGRIYYICREKSGYVIYNLEIRPIPDFKEKIEQELKDTGKKWDHAHLDELLLTKDKLDRDLKKKMNKYSEAVWVRNEIVVEPPRKPESQGK
ncbi:MAG: hypothetical protein WBG50_21305 [Desulfomonilaceae bacterium]